MRGSKKHQAALDNNVRNTSTFKSVLNVIRAGFEKEGDLADLFKIIHEVLTKQTDRETGIATLSWPKNLMTNSLHIER